MRTRNKTQRQKLEYNIKCNRMKNYYKELLQLQEKEKFLRKKEKDIVLSLYHESRMRFLQKKINHMKC